MQLAGAPQPGFGFSSNTTDASFGADPYRLPPSFQTAGDALQLNRQGGDARKKTSSWWSNVQSFVGGMFSPITGLFTSPTSFILNAGTFVLHALALGATKGAAAPAMVGLGLILALVEGGKGLHKLFTGQNDKDKKQGWFDLGACAVNFALLFLGARTALKEGMQGGIRLSKDAEQFSNSEALLEHGKRLPSSITQSAKALRNGKVKENTKESLKRQYSELKEEFQGKWEDTRNLANNGKGKLPGILKMLRSLSISSWFFP